MGCNGAGEKGELAMVAYPRPPAKPSRYPTESHAFICTSSRFGNVNCVAFSTSLARGRPGCLRPLVFRSAARTILDRMEHAERGYGVAAQAIETSTRRQKAIFRMPKHFRRTCVHTKRWIPIRGSSAHLD